MYNRKVIVWSHLDTKHECDTKFSQIFRELQPNCTYLPHLIRNELLVQEVGGMLRSQDTFENVITGHLSNEKFWVTEILIKNDINNDNLFNPIPNLFNPIKFNSVSISFKPIWSNQTQITICSIQSTPIQSNQTRFKICSTRSNWFVGQSVWKRHRNCCTIQEIFTCHNKIIISQSFLVLSNTSQQTMPHKMHI